MAIYNNCSRFEVNELRALLLVDGSDVVILKITTTRSHKHHNKDGEAAKDDKYGMLCGFVASTHRISRFDERVLWRR